VTKILIEDGKAVGLELESGEKIKAKYVVSNADARQTFLKLAGEEWLPEEFTQKLLEMEVWPSAFLISLGVDMDLGPMGFGGEAIHYSPAESIEELTTTDPAKMGIDIIIQSLRDPTLAPPGQHAVSIMTLLPYDYEDRWHTKDGKRGEEYRKLKEQVADQLIASAENVIPGLSKRIVYKDVATPLTYERYTLNYQGSIMGWLSTPENIAWIYGWGQRTPIENLYQAGHWTLPGGGIPTVIFSGKTAAQLILKDVQEAE
jgi:prolycopene isomerase